MIKVPTISIVVGCFIVSSMLGVTHGQEVYKTVDEDGKISYSTIPPANTVQSEVLDILSEPSDTEVSKAQQRNKKIQEDLKQTKQERAKESKRLAESSSASERDTVVVVPPNPAALFYPYSHYPNNWRYRPGYRPGLRPGYRHRVPGHYHRQPGYHNYRPRNHLYRPRYH
ncbi:MAG: DUF4124 domain-containing protein [bacterium]